MRATLVGVAVVAGCYAPHAPAGAPCSPATASCPDGQSCVAVDNAFACVAGPAADARTVDGALHDTALPIDAPADSPQASKWTLVKNDTSSDTATTSIAIGSGHLIVVAIETPSSGASAVVAVTDDGGNTYASAVRAVNTTTNTAVEIWYGTSAHAATTIVGAAPTIYATVVWEVAGIRATNPLDAATKADNRPASTTPVGASITTTAAGDFVVSVAIVANQVSGIRAGNAFTNDQTSYGNGWAHLTSAFAPAGTYQAQWDQPTSGAGCSSSAAFFVGP